MRARLNLGDRTRESTWEMIRASLWSTEYMTLAVFIVYTVLDLMFITEVASSLAILQINLLMIFTTIGFAVWYDQTGARLAHVLRSFYIAPLGYMAYAQVHNYIPLINPYNFDPILAEWDYAIFGVNPTEWIHQFAVPALTEYFQIWYNFFQLMLLVPALSFYMRGEMRSFRIYAMVLMLGFYVSYLCYFAMPAIGPRFELHDFYAIDRELPGLLLTEPLRDFINAGNNIPPSMTNPYDVVNRDCMPSGHTMMSILGMLMAWRYRSRWRWLMTVGGLSIVISTVYLRYHYVVDLMAGTALAIIVFATHRAVIRWWEKRGIEV